MHTPAEGKRERHCADGRSTYDRPGRARREVADPSTEPNTARATRTPGSGVGWRLGCEEVPVSYAGRRSRHQKMRRMRNSPNGMEIWLFPASTAARFRHRLLPRLNDLKILHRSRRGR